jgi:hypothetical protein
MPSLGYDWYAAMVALLDPSVGNSGGQDCCKSRSGERSQSEKERDSVVVATNLEADQRRPKGTRNSCDHHREDRKAARSVQARLNVLKVRQHHDPGKPHERYPDNKRRWRLNGKGKNCTRQGEER